MEHNSIYYLLLKNGRVKKCFKPSHIKALEGVKLKKSGRKVGIYKLYIYNNTPFFYHFFLNKLPSNLVISTVCEDFFSAVFYLIIHLCLLSSLLGIMVYLPNPMFFNFSLHLLSCLLLKIFCKSIFCLSVNFLPLCLIQNSIAFIKTSLSLNFGTTFKY